MPVQSSQIEPLTGDALPRDMRPWVEKSLILPLNRVLDLLRSLLNRGISLRTHVNCQVFERRFIVPSGSDWTEERLDTPLTLTGPVLGLQALAAYRLDTAGLDETPIGGLSLPTWREIAANGGKFLRLVHQAGLTAGHTVRVLYVAWGQ